MHQHRISASALSSHGLHRCLRDCYNYGGCDRRHCDMDVQCFHDSCVCDTALLC